MVPNRTIFNSEFPKHVAVPMLCIVILMVTCYCEVVVGNADFDNCNSTSGTNHIQNVNTNASYTPNDIVEHINDPTPNCSTGIVSTDQHHNSSTCPWYFQSHIDQWRIPIIIKYVQCRCKHCTHHYEHGGVCKEVTREFEVLRKSCTEAGRLRMTQEYQRFPVACVCVPRLPLEDRRR